MRQNATPQPSLPDVLLQSEQVGSLVKESAEELASVNAGIKAEIVNQGSPLGLESALEKSEAVQEKVQEASDKLSDINIALKEEVDERHKLEGKLAEVTEQSKADRHASLHDRLTDLPNRALFYDRLEHAFLYSKRHSCAFAVMFVDLDDFKIINDTYGHEAGDRVLQLTAERLKESIRGDDTVCRHGGDEFNILINEVRKETDISLIAQKILAKIQAPCDILIRNVVVTQKVRASMGIAVFPQHGTTADSLIAGADQAMYVAKRARSGYSFAE